MNRSNLLARHTFLRRLGVILGAVALMLALRTLVVPTVQANAIELEDGCECLATFKVADFVPAHPDVAVIRLGDFIQ